MGIYEATFGGACASDCLNGTEATKRYEENNVLVRGRTEWRGIEWNGMEWNANGKGRNGQWNNEGRKNPEWGEIEGNGMDKTNWLSEVE